jgi:ABC-type Fe3+ transport system substrate-binding protein
MPWTPTKYEQDKLKQDKLQKFKPKMVKEWHNAGPDVAGSSSKYGRRLIKVFILTVVQRHSSGNIAQAF